MYQRHSFRGRGICKSSISRRLDDKHDDRMEGGVGTAFDGRREFAIMKEKSTRPFASLAYKNDSFLLLAMMPGLVDDIEA